VFYYSKIKSKNKKNVGIKLGKLTRTFFISYKLVK